MAPALSCNNAGDTGIQLIQQNKKARAVTIPLSFVKGIPADSVSMLVLVRLAGQEPMLGKYTSGTHIVFEPVLPFSPDTEYEVWIRDKKLGSFRVPANDDGPAPKVLTIYPSADTLPENLLKIYIRFSQPMQEARSATFAGLIRNDTDTLREVFLDLQPELWNEDRTVLTLWLDPGRIKRDLQPNLRLGNPLEKNNRYSFFVKRRWKGQQGIEMLTDFKKTFVATERDSLSPEPALWLLQLPAAGSKQPLSIEFAEPLDHFLLEECLKITTAANTPVKGRFVTGVEDRRSWFIPDEPWVVGKYFLIVESKLEDLSGNNLNRPFDRDIRRGGVVSTAGSYRRELVISN